MHCINFYYFTLLSPLSNDINFVFFHFPLFGTVLIKEYKLFNEGDNKAK